MIKIPFNKYLILFIIIFFFKLSFSQDNQTQKNLNKDKSKPLVIQKNENISHVEMDRNLTNEEKNKSFQMIPLGMFSYNPQDTDTSKNGKIIENPQIKTIIKPKE